MRPEAAPVKQVLKRFWSDETGATGDEPRSTLSGTRVRTVVASELLMLLGLLGITVSGFFETVATVLANHASA